jgi:hypothetical protein
LLLLLPYGLTDDYYLLPFLNRISDSPFLFGHVLRSGGGAGGGVNKPVIYQLSPGLVIANYGRAKNGMGSRVLGNKTH